MQAQPLVIANWKMNGDRALIDQLVQTLHGQHATWQSTAVAVCPPATLLPALQVAVTATSIEIGAQTVNAAPSGAHTGELSAQLLLECGVKYVLVGHSERRQWYGCDDASAAAQVQACLAAGLTPVLCVGETQAEREQAQTVEVVTQQLQAVLKVLTAAQAQQLVIAYEPVWAIGTGLTATPAQAQAVHAEIRTVLLAKVGAAAQQMPLLYGGSVKADNAASLFAQADIDGGLIGGASLNPAEFLAICQAAG